MEIFGVGTSEFIFIILIAIIILGPKDMQKAGRTIGRFLNQLVKSDSWKIFQQTSNELRNLPQNLMREANMEMMEAEKDLRRAIDPRIGSATPPSSSSKPPSPPAAPEVSPSELSAQPSSPPNQAEAPLSESSTQSTEGNPDENA
jgi:sec-independent protein translocase protein TatB